MNIDACNWACRVSLCVCACVWVSLALFVLFHRRRFKSQADLRRWWQCQNNRQLTWPRRAKVKCRLKWQNSFTWHGTHSNESQLHMATGESFNSTWNDLHVCAFWPKLLFDGNNWSMKRFKAKLLQPEREQQQEKEREREWDRQRESESKCNGASGDAYRRRQCQYPCHFGTLSFGAATPQTTHMWYAHIHTCVCECVRVGVCLSALCQMVLKVKHTQSGRQAGRPE